MGSQTLFLLAGKQARSGERVKAGLNLNFNEILRGLRWPAGIYQADRSFFKARF